jgi:hypothetical protein
MHHQPHLQPPAATTHQIHHNTPTYHHRTCLLFLRVLSCLNCLFFNLFQNHTSMMLLVALILYIPLLGLSFQISLPVCSSRNNRFQFRRQQFGVSKELSADKSNNKNLSSYPTANNGEDDNDVPSMDWLTNALNKGPDSGDDGNDDNESFPEDFMSNGSTTPYLEEHDPEGDLGDVPIPTTGISVADEMEKAQKVRFYSEVVEISGLAKGVKAAQILTSTTGGAYEAVRYLIRLSRQDDEQTTVANYDDPDASTVTKDAVKEIEDFVMVDVPPYSKKLVKQMEEMMGPSGRLSAILVTCRDSIHYDDAPGVYSIRRADLLKWEKAFPNAAIVAYRMDIPRDCRESVTQRLDGYGPWAMVTDLSKVAKNETFVENGKPLTYRLWDPDIAMEILEGKRKPPGENDGDDDDIFISKKADAEKDDVDLYAPENIRAKEEGKRVLAIYTPGRTYGSMSYVFPELGLCASGYLLPLEDPRVESNRGIELAGPALDCRGYITTSKAGISKQMESARKLVNSYSDRFSIVLTSRGDPFYFNNLSSEGRRKTLLDILSQYEKLGSIYEQLGITGNNDFY